MKYMKGKTSKVVETSEAYRVPGKGLVSTKWADRDKSHGNGEMIDRSRWVARDFKLTSEQDREDFFSATPSLELVKYVISRQATRRGDGQERKTLYIDVELLTEAEVEEDECGKLIYCGCRLPAQALEDHHSGVLTTVGFKRSLSSSVAFYHPERDLVEVAHGDDFVSVGVDKELNFVLSVLKEHHELKDRGRLRSEFISSYRDSSLELVATSHIVVSPFCRLLFGGSSWLDTRSFFEAHDSIVSP